MTEATAYVAESAEEREQPFFYSWNRRLRHLHGISFRNLDVTPPSARLRGKTITEDDYNIKSQARLLVQDERISFHASKSFDDLSKVTRPLKSSKSLAPHDQPGRPLQRPSKLRRRSTLHWASVGPQQRQQKLEDVALHRLVDTWFSVHCPGLEEPVYVSEVMEKSMNPTFSYFDLDRSAVQIVRSDECEIKVWAKTIQQEDYILLVDLVVNLRSLQFLGKSLDSFHHPLPTNCILFHLEDGVYTSFTDLAADGVIEPRLRPSQKEIAPVGMSSYDALMKLANLDECIQDALNTRGRLEAEINALLAKNRDNQFTPVRLESQREQSKQTKSALAAQKRAVEQLRNRRDDLQQRRISRKGAVAQALEDHSSSAKFPDICKKEMERLQEQAKSSYELASGQIRRVCEDLLRIYPIEPIKNRSLQFTIRGIPLPNSAYDDTNRDQIAAALGYAGHLVHHLALYLSMPLPYPIEPNGSSTYIDDPISISLAQRRFPLHPINVNYKFEYGVFLLNKNIEFLSNRTGLRVVDIRHTLPNLKYLLYVLTARTSELPARKAGGIRGLWGGPLSPAISRRGSDDSVNSRGSVEVPNGNVSQPGKEKSLDRADVISNTARAKALPYRRSQLREVEQ